MASKQNVSAAPPDPHANIVVRPVHVAVAVHGDGQRQSLRRCLRQKVVVERVENQIFLSCFTADHVVRWDVRWRERLLGSHGSHSAGTERAVGDTRPIPPVRYRGFRPCRHTRGPSTMSRSSRAQTRQRPTGYADAQPFDDTPPQQRADEYATTQSPLGQGE